MSSCLLLYPPLILSSSCIYPHLTSPHLTSPHLTSPHLTSPHLTSPHLIISSSHPIPSNFLFNFTFGCTLLMLSHLSSFLVLYWPFSSHLFFFHLSSSLLSSCLLFSVIYVSYVIQSPLSSGVFISKSVCPCQVSSCSMQCLWLQEGHSSTGL